ncbi:MAG: hypothetical protein GWP47_12610 [Actinobacteria bacterium]|nr:hypothetical protein [Actinomycetota bacterium]NCG38386.1 hypothetical protein [Actinomycetota bacterium]
MNPSNQRDGKVPGIGHFIHRSTDPRHDLLMDRLAGADLNQRRMDVAASLISLTSERIPVAPNVDFAIARTAGWLAHALEEYEETPIWFRPVGRYVVSPASHQPPVPVD